MDLAMGQVPRRRHRHPGGLGAMAAALFTLCRMVQGIVELGSSRRGLEECQMSKVRLWT